MGEDSKGTLGDILYASAARATETEGQWVALVRAMAAGDQQALHGLYERTHRVVFTLIVRLVGDREAAEGLTLDVFHDLWRRAEGYDPSNGTVLGWIMNQARSRAIDQVRFDHRQKRTDPGDAPQPASADQPRAQEALERNELHQRLRTALGALSSSERKAIEAAFFLDLTHAETAERLDEPLGTVKTRIRAGLIKLRRALDEGGSP